jgi:hypothetical protein
MRHHFFFSKDTTTTTRHWREEVLTGIKLQTLSDVHKREMAALERAMLKRIEAAERLCKLVLFEQDRARLQIHALCHEVAALREEVRGAVVVDCSNNSNNSNNSSRVIISEDGRTIGWVDVDDDGGDNSSSGGGGYDV